MPRGTRAVAVLFGVLFAIRTAERLVKLIAVFCILSWRVFWMTMLNRSTPNANPSLALRRIETAFLDRLVPDHKDHQLRKKMLSNYLIKIAQLGGCLARASNPPPGIPSCGAGFPGHRRQIGRNAQPHTTTCG